MFMWCASKPIRENVWTCILSVSVVKWEGEYGSKWTCKGMNVDAFPWDSLCWQASHPNHGVHTESTSYWNTTSFRVMLEFFQNVSPSRLSTLEIKCKQGEQRGTNWTCSQSVVALFNHSVNVTMHSTTREDSGPVFCRALCTWNQQTVRHTNKTASCYLDANFQSG